MNKQIYDYVLVLIACIILCRSGSDAEGPQHLLPLPDVVLPHLLVVSQRGVPRPRPRVTSLLVFVQIP